MQPGRLGVYPCSPIAFGRIDGLAKIGCVVPVGEDRLIVADDPVMAAGSEDGVAMMVGSSDCSCRANSSG